MPLTFLINQEYYEEESIVGLYRSVLERLLVTLDDEEDKVIERHAETVDDGSGLVVHEERLRVWPPWPWPPWGDDDDKPENRTERAHKHAKAIIELERQIAKASLDLDVLYQDPLATYNPMPFKNVSDSLPEFDFSTYFSAFAPRNFPETIIVTSTTYLSDLSKILNDTDKNTLEAYFVTRAALEYSSHLGLDTEAWKATRSLEEVLNGIKKGAVGDRAEYCVSRAESAMGFALGRYFVREKFGGASREKATKVITGMSFVHTWAMSADKVAKTLLRHSKIRSASWSGWTKRALTLLLRRSVISPLCITTRCGIDGHRSRRMPSVSKSATLYLPTRTTLARSLTIIHASRFNLTPSSKTLLAQGRRLVESYNALPSHLLTIPRVADQIRTWYQIGKRRDHEAWEMYPSTVNAYYNPPGNEVRHRWYNDSVCRAHSLQIVFPAGILQPPFFHVDW